MIDEDRYKGKIVIAIGFTNVSIIKVCDDGSANWKQIEEEELNEYEPKELENLNPGIYELEIDYYGWEENNEDGYMDGDSEFKILSVTKL